MVNRKAERHLAEELRDVLAPLEVGDQVPDSPRWRDALSSMEFWWPSVYGWEEESLDDFWISEAVKTGPGRVRLRGLALLISDQVWTPCMAEIGVDSEGHRVESYDLRLGQPGAGELGLDRAAKYRSPKAEALRARLTSGVRLDRWVFEAKNG